MNISLVQEENNILAIKNVLRNESYAPGEYPVLLISESTLTTIPTTFTLLLQNLQASRQQITEFDLIFVVIYGVALECGFYTDPDATHVCERITQKNWDFSFNYDLIYDHLKIYGDYIEMNGNVYKLNLNLVNSLPYFTTKDDNKDETDTSTDDYAKYDFNLFCLKNGHSFLVTLVSNRNIKNSFSVYVPISKYLPFPVVENQMDYKMYYRNLPELAMKLKDQLFNPAKNFYFDEIERVPQPSLLGMPYELFVKIVRYLDHKQRLNLRLTCKRLDFRLANEQ